MSKGARHAGRARAFQVLYGLTFFKEPEKGLAGEGALRAFFDRAPSNRADDDPLDEGVPVKIPHGYIDAEADTEETETAVHREVRPAREAGGHQRPDADYAWELVKGVWARREDLDAVVGRFSRHWKLGRIARVELTILRLALYEMLLRDDIPPKVAINEGVELAKAFGDENSKSFVNGILDAAAKAVAHGEIGSDTGRGPEPARIP